MQCGIGHCGHCQLGPTLVCRDGPVYRWSRARAVAARSGSCDGDAAQADARGVEVRLLRRLPAQPARLRGRAAGARRPRSRSPTSSRRSSATVEGPYDVSLVEGSITTAARRRADPRGPRQLAGADHDRRLRHRRRDPGAAQLRRRRGVHARSSTPRPTTSRRSATSTPISAHVPVDFELHGCPINKRQLLEVISAHLNRRRPRVRAHSVCVECKRRGTVCVMVAHGTPCLGPVTHAGCGALCPAYDRGCYGCYGPKETPNTASLRRAWPGSERRVDLVRVYRTFNAARRRVPRRRARPMSD